jgi:[acyl-carrier-protein] S-malonyltransferase
MKIGMIFPGYGSQFVGMCKELYDTSRIVQEYFEEASNCLNSNFIKLNFASSDVELAKIQNAYPAIFLASSSIAALLKQEGIQPHVIAGYNSGEFAALFAAGSISFPDSLYLLSKYASAYQELLDEIKDIAILRITGVSFDELEATCKNVRDEGAAVDIAISWNKTEHIITGLAPAVDQVCKLLDTSSGIKIKAATPELGLHSLLMDPVVSRLTMYLEKVDFYDPSVSLIAGSTGELIQSAQSARANIMAFINKRVDIPCMVEQFQSCDCIIEIGPSNLLHSILETWYPDKQILSVNKPEDIDIVKSVCIKQEIQAESIDEHI